MMINFVEKDMIKINNMIYEINNNNGNGKEYDNNGVLKFEGEYLNGVRNGKGKEYNLMGKLLFEGEYLNDIQWNGKGYNGKESNNNDSYELRQGKGIKKNILIRLIYCLKVNIQI